MLNNLLSSVAIVPLGSKLTDMSAQHWGYPMCAWCLRHKLDAQICKELIGEDGIKHDLHNAKQISFF